MIATAHEQRYSLDVHGITAMGSVIGPETMILLELELFELVVELLFLLPLRLQTPGTTCSSGVLKSLSRHFMPLEARTLRDWNGLVETREFCGTALASNRVFPHPALPVIHPRG